MKSNNNLVIIAAGSNTLHKSWLKSKNRKFDIFTVDFTENKELEGLGEDFYLNEKGAKWSLLHSAFSILGDKINNYNAVWLPDDDILISTEKVEFMFNYFEKSGFDIAQPGLSRDSYFSHLMTLSIPGVAYRTTNFVEIMVPILKTNVLHQYIPLMKGMKSGWGLDFLWMKQSNEKHIKIGILDKVQVKHTRPINSPMRQGGKSKGFYKDLLPWDELDRFVEDQKITHFGMETKRPYFRQNWRMPFCIFKLLRRFYLFNNRKHIKYQLSQFENL